MAQAIETWIPQRNPDGTNIIVGIPNESGIISLHCLGFRVRLTPIRIESRNEPLTTTKDHVATQDDKEKNDDKEKDDEVISVHDDDDEEEEKDNVASSSFPETNIVAAAAMAASSSGRNVDDDAERISKATNLQLEWNALFG